MPTETPVFLSEAFCKGLEAALEMMTGERPEIARMPHSDASADSMDGTEEWWRQEFSLSPNAVLAIGASEQVWEALGNRVLRGQGILAPAPAVSRDSSREVMTQALSAVAAAAGAVVQQEVTCGTVAESRGEAPWKPGWSIEVRYPDASIGPILLAANPAFLDLPVAAERQREENRATAAEPAPEAARPEEHGLDLLADVELPVAVSIGKARLALKDVLKLGIGSIVELNRTLTEPVDVVVNNCIIARGDVVVVDGNFGVRVLQVVGRRQRMEAMR